MSNIHPIPQPDSILNSFSTIYLERKSALNEAKRAFEEIERRIVDHCGHKEEGAATFNTDDFKITTTGKITRAIDADHLDELKNKIPQPLFNRLFNFKPTLNTREYKYIMANEPEMFEEVSKFVTAKPAKTSLKIEVAK